MKKDCIGFKLYFSEGHPKCFHDMRDRKAVFLSEVFWISWNTETLDKILAHFEFHNNSVEISKPTGLLSPIPVVSLL